MGLEQFTTELLTLLNTGNAEEIFQVCASFLMTCFFMAHLIYDLIVQLGIIMIHYADKAAHYIMCHTKRYKRKYRDISGLYDSCFDHLHSLHMDGCFDSHGKEFAFLLKAIETQKNKDLWGASH